jgi:hypothetical protein
MPSTIYQGETLQLREDFTLPNGDAVQVDSAVFALEDPNGVVVSIPVVLAADRKSATASYDVPVDAVVGSWTWVCQTGGDGHRLYRHHPLSVLERPVAAIPPADPYWARVYYGTGAAGIVDPEVVGAFETASLGGTRDVALEFAPEEEALYLAVPAGWAVEATHGGAPVAFGAPTTITLTGYDGELAEYQLLESTADDYDSTAFELTIAEAET